MTKYFYINILTLALFVFCTISHSLDVLIITYAVMMIHELSHAIAAKCIGLKISYIAFHPFGVNLKLANKMVYSLSDEIILYLSGPLCNAFFALAAVYLYKEHSNEYLKFFYTSNTMLFLMNMLPAVPLDGGIILKKILSYKLGTTAAEKKIKVLSIIVSFTVMLLGIYVLYVTKFNFSVLLFSVLMIGNIFTQKEKYNVDFVKELMFHKKKKNAPIKHIIESENCDYYKIAGKFDMKNYHIVYIADNNGKIHDMITETQIMDNLINK